MQRVRWRAMWWHAGTGHQRSSSTGCTIASQVTYRQHTMKTISYILGFTFLALQTLLGLSYSCTIGSLVSHVSYLLWGCLPLSGLGVSRRLLRWDEHRPGAVPRERQYPLMFPLTLPLYNSLIIHQHKHIDSLPHPVYINDVPII